MPTKTKKTATKSGGANSKKAPPKPVIYVCPYTGQDVFIAKATLTELKNKSYFLQSSKKKRLWMIPSEKIRTDLYIEAAAAIASVEQSLLPSMNCRSWEVEVHLRDPTWCPASVLFRAWKGQLELAVLPHLIEKIPNPPTWPGKRQQPDEYLDDDDDDNHRQLQDREVSNLSSVAYGLKDDYPIPTVVVKWKSPDHKIFHSRVKAWEYAKEMAKKEVEIDKTLFGIGASGKLLQPFVPSASKALSAGLLRFERDGLWVVGQELDWQAGRPDELIKEKEERQRQKEEEEAAAAAEEEMEDEEGGSAASLSGLPLFLDSKRQAYRESHEDCTSMSQALKELRKIWKVMTPDEKKEWIREDVIENNDTTKESEDSLNTKGKKRPMTPLKYFIQCRRFEHRKEMSTNGSIATLLMADTELRRIWRSMTEKQQEEWTLRLENGESDVESKKCDDANGMKLSIDDKQLDDTPKEEGSSDVDVEVHRETVQETMEVAPTTSSSEEFAEEKKEEDPVGNSTENSNTPPNDGFSAEVTCSVTATQVNEDGPELLLEGPPISEGEQVVNTSDATKDVPKSAVAPGKIIESRDSVSEVKPEATLSSEPSTIVKPPPPKRKSYGRARVVNNKTSRRWCMSETQIKLCHEACMEHYETVMRTVKLRDLSRELQDGFDVLRERGFGRFDMELPAFDEAKFSFLTDLEKSPWMPVVRKILGDDVILIHKGCFLSMPGAAMQEYHQDGVHLTTQAQRPCHAVNVFIPLVDLCARNGPTEFCLGSHILGHEGYDRDFVETPKPSAGCPVVFDYRLGHRGLGNSSMNCRPIVYCTYARAADGKEFRDSVNFSRRRYHKIGELAEKPKSREERRNNRKRNIEQRKLEEVLSVLEGKEGQADNESMEGEACKSEEVNRKQETITKEESTAIQEPEKKAKLHSDVEMVSNILPTTEERSSTTNDDMETADPAIEQQQ